MLRISTPVANPGAGPNNVRHETQAAACLILGWQETREHVGRQLRVGINGSKTSIHLARLGVEADFNLHVEGMAVVRHCHDGLIMLTTGRHGKLIVAKAHFG